MVKSRSLDVSIRFACKIAQSKEHIQGFTKHAQSSTHTVFADNQISIPVNISCFLGLFFLNLFIFLFSECQSKALYNFLHALFVEAYDQIAKESLKKNFILLFCFLFLVLFF